MPSSAHLAVPCLLAAALIAPVQALPQTPDSAQATRAVLAFEEARFAAMVRADTTWLRDALAGDLSYVHTSARHDTKTQYLQSVGSGALRYDEFTPKERQVFLLGTSAVAVAGLAHARAVSGGQVYDFDVRYLAVYKRFGVRWQLVAWQTTRVP